MRSGIESRIALLGAGRTVLGAQAAEGSIGRMTEAGPLLRIAGISKSFGPSRALSDVSFEIGAGRVHALVGENGAGKSTLVKIVTGILDADDGTLLLGGEAVRFATPIEARRAGVAAVYQDPKLSRISTWPRTSRWATRRSPRSAWSTARRCMRAPATPLGQLGVAVDPRALIAGLSVAELQFVEIARALTADVRLLILDEPTSALTPAEAEKLFRIVRGLRARGHLGPADHPPPRGARR